jgi:RNA polymerase sigma factor (TIGR02999 family)
LLPIVYEELRRLARGKMANESPGHTLQATALVHEAWLRLGAEAQPSWQNRAHFFAAAAEAMRRILIEGARRRLAAKRGSGAKLLDADDIEIPSPTPNDDKLLRVNEAVEKLRYFVGMTFEETALAMGIAVPTAKKWWSYARAWLDVELKNSAQE